MDDAILKTPRIKLIAFIGRNSVQMVENMGTMNPTKLFALRPNEHQFAVTKTDKEYWLIDLYSSRVTEDHDILLGEHKVFATLEAAITAGMLLA